VLPIYCCSAAYVHNFLCIGKQSCNYEGKLEAIVYILLTSKSAHASYATTQNSCMSLGLRGAPDAATTSIHLEAASRVIALTARLVCQTPPQDCWIIPVLGTICLGVCSLSTAHRFIVISTVQVCVIASQCCQGTSVITLHAVQPYASEALAGACILICMGRDQGDTMS